MDSLGTVTSVWVTKVEKVYCVQQSCLLLSKSEWQSVWFPPLGLLVPQAPIHTYSHSQKSGSLRNCPSFRDFFYSRTVSHCLGLVWPISISSSLIPHLQSGPPCQSPAPSPWLVPGWAQITSSWATALPFISSSRAPETGKEEERKERWLFYLGFLFADFEECNLRVLVFSLKKDKIYFSPV